mgnify:CR=1 FL=1|tara:strand:+ start:2319 stop:2546 length:228 start_codon:yes stop_codon:yes gene_type:complete
MKYEITTQKELRKAFWQGYKTLNNINIIKLYNQVTKKPLTQNEYNATIRSEWCEFLDAMQKEGIISEKLSNKAIL